MTENALDDYRRHKAQRSELLPSPASIASVLAVGLFALSLAGLGLGWEITRKLRRKRK